MSATGSIETPFCIILCRGVFFVCRRNQLRGFVLLGFGVGLIVGHGLDSWLLCWCGGGGLILLALCMLKTH